MVSRISPPSDSHDCRKACALRRASGDATTIATARGRRVVFEVYGDGKLLTRSRAVALNEASVSVEADVRGRKLIELVARADSAPDAALPVVWGDARLTG
jgi:hypothetical protein